MTDESAKKPPLTSVYWGFFNGGARNVHTDTILALHEQGMEQRVLHYFNVLDRGSEGIHRAPLDGNYKRLNHAGIGIDSLNFDQMGIDPYACTKQFTGSEDPADPQEKAVRRLAFALHATSSKYVLCLKEQPVNMLVEANRYLEEVLHLPPRPLIITLHRTDPGADGPAAIEALRRIEHDPATKRYVLGYIACAESAAYAYQKALGLEQEPDRFKIIPNGIDLRVFHPQSAEAKAELVKKHFLPGTMLSPDHPIITFAARNSAEKNPELFLDAAWRFLKSNPNAHAVMCGAGMDMFGTADMIQKTLAASDLSENEKESAISRLHALGKLCQNDIAALCSMSQVMALTSPNEADPLVLKEGMACGAVPVTTSTGDTPFTVGINHPHQHMCQPITEGIAVGSRGVLTSLNPDDIAAGWEHAIVHHQNMQGALKIQRPLLDRMLMAKSYEIAMDQLWAQQYQVKLDARPGVITSEITSERRLRDNDGITYA